jgi:hypothetical protein
MRINTRIPTLSLAALTAFSFVSLTATTSQAQGPCSLFCCFFGSRCSDSCGSGCGCGVGCGMDGRQFAGQTWSGCCEEGPRLCYCRDAGGQCTGGMCGGSVNSCGCGCEPTCAAEPSCGCASNCGPSNPGCCLFDCLFGCTGCDGEFYWSEWHNDPPRCDNPCDCYGNWIGPSAGYRAPYAHAYSPAVAAPTPYYANQSPQQMNPHMATPPTYARSQQPRQIPANNYGTSVYGPSNVTANRQPQSAQATPRYAANRTTRTAPPTPIAQRPGAAMSRPVYR